MKVFFRERFPIYGTSYCTLQCMHMCILFRLRNAQDQLVHLKHEEDQLNKVLDEDEAQINKITELITVVEM